MAKKGITGTDTDLVVNLPTIPDAKMRGTEIQKLMEALDGLEINDPAVQAFRDSVKAQAKHVGSTDSEVDVDGHDAGEVQDVDSDEGTTTEASGDVEGGGEQLDERLTACLEQLGRDFDRGIVRIDEKSTPEQYAMALKADKTAGQKWETLEARLRANGADLLKKAAAMPEGACLVGVYENGELAIRQRSQEIMNARWTKEWKDGSSDRGELLLLPHAAALARSEGRWAKAGEIVQKVKAAGYHVPADLPNYEKAGLVAAAEAVTGGHYVMSPDGNEWRSAMFECDENVPDYSVVRVVNFYPGYRDADVGDGDADYRRGDRGAVLWLRG